MDESRLVITDRQWAKMEPHCLGRKQDPGRTGSDPRQFPEAVFWSEGMNATGPRECPNADGCALARFAIRLWQVEYDLSALPGLGASRCFRAYIQCVIG